MDYNNMPPIRKEKCTYQKLYQTTLERFAVYNSLSETFKTRFEQVLKLAKEESPYLVKPAIHFKNDIKEKYINEGYKLIRVEDLEIILKELNYIKFKDFKEDKHQFDRLGYIEDIPELK